jgi:PAS domain S-box-containing protein/putative nucleotidyltransferase with HDIG domain
MNEKKKSSKTLPRPKAKPKAPPARKRRAFEVPYVSETLYRTLAEAAPDMIFIIGRDDRVEYVNRIAAESLGRKPEDLIGKPRAQFFPSGPSQRQGERISDVFESGKPLFIEHCTPFKGWDLWMHTWLVPLKNESGKVASVLGISRDITERKKMEESLRESEEKYRTLVERAQDGILIVQEGNVIYANPSLAAMGGYTTEEVLDTPLTQYIHPDVLPQILDRYRRRLAGEDVPAIYELTLLRKDGSKLPAEINAGVIGYQGKPADLVIIRDLTERKQAEEKVLESELQHRTTLDFMGDAIHVVDRDLQLVLLNERFKQWCRELGLETEVIGRTVFEAFPFLPETVREEYEQVFRTGETLVTEEASQVGEREIITETRKIPILKGGEVAQVVTVVHDITKRKRGEEALQESQERLSRIVETAPDGITIVDRKGRITFANAAAERILGLSRSDITQRVYNDPAWRITTLDGRPFPDEDLPFTRVMGTGEAVFAIEHAIEHPDGRRVFLSINAAPLRDGQGRTSGMVVSLADITERKRVEEDIQKNLRKLRQALWETIQAIALIIETKDPYTAGHQRRSTQLAEAIARELGLPEEQVEGIRMSGFIHDLGKIAVPSEILSKPSPLNEIERAIIQNHVRAGYEILKTVEFPWPVAQVVLQHHERLDGSGYPSGLTGEGILLEARILAVADVVEAMASYRPYRPARGIEEAFREIAQGRDRLYDPQVVDACLKLFSEKGFTFEPKEGKG